MESICADLRLTRAEARYLGVADEAPGYRAYNWRVDNAGADRPIDRAEVSLKRRGFLAWEPDDKGEYRFGLTDIGRRAVAAHRTSQHAT